MIDRDELPSVSALLVADVDVDEAVRRLDLALKARRLARWDRSLPGGYPAERFEWLGFEVREVPGLAAVAIAPHAPGDVFEIACWCSEAWPEELLVAYQRLRGGRPVAKFLVAGAPRWKDGEDADHEVGWHVPKAPPAETRLPPRRGLPDSAAAAEELLEPVLRPFPRNLVPAAGGRVVSYVDRRSPLA